jgi:hypothetical protein
MNDKRISKMDDGRVSVPLVMIDGNMDILLNHLVPCKGVSLRWSEDHAHAVVLVLHGADQEAADHLGFQLRDQS